MKAAFNALIIFLISQVCIMNAWADLKAPFTPIEVKDENNRCVTKYNNLVSNLETYKNSTKLLRELLNNECALVKGIAVYLLGESGTKESLSLIRKALADKQNSDPMLNCMIVYQLAANKDKEAISLIIEAIDSDSFDSSCSSDPLEALAIIDIEKSLNYLVNFANNPQNRLFDRALVLEWLSKTSNSRAQKALERIVKSQDEQLSSIAQQLLNRKTPN